MLVRMHYAPTAYLWWSRAMLAPDQMVWRIPHWMRALLVGCFVVLVTGAGLFAYHYFTSPKTMTIAAGSSDGEAVRLMSAIAVQLTKTGARIRLKITDSGSTLGAAQAFSAGKVDPAIVRADLGDLSAARTVVRVTYGVVMILVPPGSSAKGIEGLAGKTVGVVDEEMNHRFVEVLTHEYDLARAKVRFKNLLAVDAQHALQSNQVGALLVVVPISEKHVSLVRSFSACGRAHLGETCIAGSKFFSHERQAETGIGPDRIGRGN